MTFYEKVDRWIDAEALIPAEAAILVAFSGGPDSSALLDVLCRLAAVKSWRVEALHLDHGLREGSAREAEHAVSLGERVGVAVAVERLRIAPGPNLQERARDARLRALAERAEALGCSRVALGHTADDQAETVLMRLVRGTGPAGLGGMAPERGIFVRPLMARRKSEILAYLDERGIGLLEDPSNGDRRFLRTRAREEWIPLLEEANPRLVEGICRLARQARQERCALKSVVESLLEQRWRPGGPGALGRVDLRGLPGGKELLPNMLRGAYARLMGSTRGLGADHVAAVEALLESGGSRGVDLPGLRAELRYEELVLLGGQPDEAPLRSLRVEGPGRYRLGADCCVEIVEGQSSGALDELPKGRLAGGVILRPPSAGDKICIDAQRKKRVARILIDAKVEQAVRARRPMVVHDGEPLLIIGLRRASGWRPPDGAVVWKFSISP